MRLCGLFVLIEKERKGYKMTEREKLIELLDQNCGYVEEQKAETLADYLLDNGVIVPPCKAVWYIVNRNTEFECVMSANIENLPLYIIKNLDKYEYYECKEEAEKALKEREEK